MSERSRKVVTLRKLREKLRCSDKTVARAITGSLTSVGAFEERTDVQASFLRMYAEMFGGTLQVVIRLPNGEEFLIAPFSSGTQ